MCIVVPTLYPFRIMRHLTTIPLPPACEAQAAHNPPQGTCAAAHPHRLASLGKHRRPASFRRRLIQCNRSRQLQLLFQNHQYPKRWRGLLHRLEFQRWVAHPSALQRHHYFPLLLHIGSLPLGCGPFATRPASGLPSITIPPTSSEGFTFSGTLFTSSIRYYWFALQCANAPGLANLHVWA